MSQYWTYENKIIFKPSFNGPIKNYHDQILKYDEIIFSDTECFDFLKRVNFSNYAWPNYSSWKNSNDVEYLACSKFNDQIDFTSYSDLTRVIFGYTFNQPVNLPMNLTHVSFGNDFNKQIDLPTSLHSVTFGDNFNQFLILPANLHSVTFGYQFNQSLILPDKLRYITFGDSFNQEINLPQNIKNLIFGTYFNKPINLPFGIKNLTFGTYFNQSQIHYQIV